MAEQNLKGKIAVCSRGAVGLITSDGRVPVTYPDGTKDMAHTGVHLTSYMAEIGSPWSSRHPHVLCDSAEVVAALAKFNGGYKDTNEYYRPPNHGKFLNVARFANSEPFDEGQAQGTNLDAGDDIAQAIGGVCAPSTRG